MPFEHRYAIKNYSSTDEREARSSFVSLFRDCPIPDDQILSNLPLFMNSIPNLKSDSLLLRHKGILFRGFKCLSAENLHDVIEASQLKVCNFYCVNCLLGSG